MRNVVTGLMMLAGAVIREQGQQLDDAAWRRGAQAAVSSEVVASNSVTSGDWDVACLGKGGSKLVLDRQSVREIGRQTLFRWAAPAGERPESTDPIYTAVADCRAKSIEASWPGKRTSTRAGSCGRYLVEAACATAAR